MLYNIEHILIQIINISLWNGVADKVIFSVVHEQKHGIEAVLHLKSNHIHSNVLQLIVYLRHLSDHWGFVKVPDMAFSYLYHLRACLVIAELSF